MTAFTKMKIISTIGIITAVMLAAWGITGHMSSFIGGIGWAVVVLNWCKFFSEAIRDEKIFKKIMKMDELKKQKEKINEQK